MSRARSLFAVLAAVLLSAGALVLAGSAPASAGVAPDLIGTDGNDLVKFNAATPGTVTVVTVTPPTQGDFLRGIDFRPANGLLYGLFQADDGSLKVAVIDPATGASSAALAVTTDGSIPVLISGGTFGLEFNPVADRLRVVTDNDENFRVNVDTGIAIEDTDLNGPGSEGQGVIAAAYTNDQNPAPGSTTLFDISFDSDSLMIQNPPNDGTLTEVGSLNTDPVLDAGFTIHFDGTTNTGLAAIRTPIVQPAGLAARPKAAGNLSVTALYDVNLGTGTATLIGTIGDGNQGIESLTTLPFQVPATTTTTLATTTTTAAVSPTSVVLVRTGDEETRQGWVGIGLIAAGGAALVAASRIRSRRA